MITRRDFLKITGGSTVAWYVATQTGWIQRAVAAIPGGTLDPAAIPRFVTPLLIPPVMPRAGRISQRGGQPIDSYEISMRQFSQQILPATMPATTVWGYGAVRSASKRGLLLHNAPSLTIEARWNRPVRVKWINDLVDEDGDFLPHVLPVDPTLHWANPPGGTEGRDMRPTFETTPGPYTGPVPIVTHVHGSASVGDESDGYAEAWYLPDANDIPEGYATEGTWYDFFADKAASKFGVAWGPGFATFQYPNSQRASTIWYHDHALGMTRLNVYAGPAGFFLIRGGPEGDGAVLDSRSGTTAVLPGPAPKPNDRFPSTKTYYEIPIAIQDRLFNTNGSLFYPDMWTFFDGITGPYIPETDVSPIWNPEFFGNTIMVNGNTWPFQTVERRRYRFRFLNGCQSRVPNSTSATSPAPRCGRICNEEESFPRRAGEPARGERQPAADGSGGAGRRRSSTSRTCPWASTSSGTSVRTNRSVAYSPAWTSSPRTPASTGRVLQFRVVPAVAPDPSTPPRFLVLPAISRLTGGTARPLALLEEMSEFDEPPDDFEDAPTEAHLGTIEGDPDTGTGVDDGARMG